MTFVPDETAARPFDLLVLGGVCLEQAVRLPDWPAAGHRRTAILDLAVTPGGSAPNVAVFAARAGARAAFVGKVGDDARGHDLLDALRREGVNVSDCRVMPGPATTFQVVLTVGDDWSVLLHADPALDFVPEDLPEALFGQARVLHLDGYGMFTDSQKATVERAMALARANRVKISIDAGTQMAVEQPEYLREAMARADIAFANLEEARRITRTHTETGVIRKLQGLGPSLVVLKRGERGCVVIAPNRTREVPAYRVPVADTVGAGDGFAAGMLAGLCRGERADQAARRGAAVAGLVCTGASSMGSRFGPAEIDRLRAEGKTHASR